jgi:hypothetical protein
MIYEFNNPMPVETDLGYGMLIYVRCGGTFSNDVFAIVLDKDGVIRHFTSDQFKFVRNDTFGIRTEDDEDDDGGDSYHHKHAFGQ